MSDDLDFITEAHEEAEQREYITDIEAQAALMAELVAALTPSAETKAAYMGKFHFLQEAYFVEHDKEVTFRVTVPWTTIKEIMKAIHTRALANAKAVQP